jgi:hypothetical protein
MGLKIFEQIKKDTVRTMPAHWQRPYSFVLSTPCMLHHERHCHHRWPPPAIVRTSTPPRPLRSIGWMPPHSLQLERAEPVPNNPHFLRCFDTSRRSTPPVLPLSVLSKYPSSLCRFASNRRRSSAWDSAKKLPPLPNSPLQ